MKKLLLVICVVLMVAELNAQNNTNRNATPQRTNTTTTDTAKRAPAAKPQQATPAQPASKIATSKEFQNSPDVVLGKGNYFTGEILVVGDSKVFLTKENNVFVWMRQGKAIEIKMLPISVYTKRIEKNYGFIVYDQYPVIIKIKNEEFLVYYFMTSGGGFYGYPDGTIQKEKRMKQSGVIRVRGLEDMEGVKEIASLRELIQQMENNPRPAATSYDDEY